MKTPHCISCISMINIVLKSPHKVQRKVVYIESINDSFFGQPFIFDGQPQGNTSQVLGYSPNDSFCKAPMEITYKENTVNNVSSADSVDGDGILP